MHALYIAIKVIKAEEYKNSDLIVLHISLLAISLFPREAFGKGDKKNDFGTSIALQSLVRRAAVAAIYARNACTRYLASRLACQSRSTPVGPGALHKSSAPKTWSQLEQGIVMPK